MIFALDTSVMLCWFSQAHNADTERALRLRTEQLEGKVELTVLDQSVYELLHILKQSAGFDREQINAALDSLECMHLTIAPYTPEIMRKAAQIAFEHDISLYAACFVALGAQIRCQAITCDQELYRKIATLPWTLVLSNLTL